MRRPLVLVSTLLVVAACGDATRSTGPVMGNVPSFAISDGANTGGGPANGDFFFLPPMVPDPSGALTYDAGAFDASRQPRIEICRLTAVEPRVCAESLRTFESSVITVSTTDEHYQVNWHTDEDHLGLDQIYRIQVQVPRHEHDGVVQYHTLGYADIDPVSSGKELKNVATGELIGLVDGRTLPIKFRIERSPRCENSDDCVEAVVSDQGGRVETESGYAIAEFPDGWLPDGFDEVVVSIRRVAIGSGTGQETSCHGSAHRQYEGCYDFATFPDVGQFDLPAVASTCIEPDAAAFEDVLQLYASDEGEQLRALPPRTVMIECEGFAGTSAPIGLLGRIGNRMLALGARLGVAVAPRELHAVDMGRGGSIDRFSHVGWILPVSVDRLAPSDEVSFVAAGSVVPVGVMVRSAHESQLDEIPLDGLPVTFSVSDGGGTLDVALVLTNSDGVASAIWTVGLPGQHVLTASVGGVELTIPVTAVTALPTTTVLQAPSLAIDGEPTVLTATVGGGLPQEGEAGQVSFFDDGELLGTGTVNGDGVASLVVPAWALRDHVLTASFGGTPTLAPSAAGAVTMQVARRYGDASAFFDALGDVGSDQENFDEMAVFTPISTIIPGVLAVSSPFERLEVYSDNNLFGYDVEGTSTRQNGLGRYELELLASRNAIAFAIDAKDPNTGPMTIEVHTAAGMATFSVQNTASESDPVFVSIIASQPITKVVVIEGPEVTGTGSEETALDDFIVANAIGPF